MARHKTENRSKRITKIPTLQIVKMISVPLLLLILFGAVMLSFVDFVTKETRSRIDDSQFSRLKSSAFSVENIIKQVKEQTDILVGENTSAALLDMSSEEHITKNENLLYNFFDKNAFVNSAVVIDFVSGKAYTGNRFLSARTIINSLSVELTDAKTIMQNNKKEFEFLTVNPEISSTAFAEMEKFCMMRPLMSPDYSEVAGCILIMLNRNVFRNVTGISFLPGTSEFVILDYRNKIFLATREMFLPQDLNYDALMPGRSEKYKTSVGGDRINLYSETTQSDSYKCVLISLYPKISVFSTSSFAPVAFVIVIAFLGLMWLALAYSKKTYTIVVSQIMLNNTDQEAFAVKHLFNEKNTLQNVIAKQILKAKSAEKAASSSAEILAKSLLTELITGTTDEMHTVQQLESAGVNFPNDKFVVLSCVCANLEAVAARGKVVKRAEQNMLCFLVDNILNEYYNCASLVLKNTQVHIVNYRTNDKSVIESVKLICDVLKKELDTELIFGIGQKYSDIMKVSDSYRESIFAIEQAFKSNSRYFEYGMAVNRSKNDSSYAWLIEIQYHLINACKSENWQEAIQIYKNIYERILLNKYFNTDVAKVQITDVMNAVVQQISSMNLFGNMEISSLGKISDEVLGLQDPALIEEKAKEFYCIFKDSVKNVKIQESIDLINRVNAIVEKKYSDIDLGVASIADQLCVNPKSLSAVYKQQTGKGLLDTIHTKRTQEAKKYLKETDKSITEISSLAGYENVNTFIRVFKKYSGMTPGAYRETKPF